MSQDPIFTEQPPRVWWRTALPFVVAGAAIAAVVTKVQHRAGTANSWAPSSVLDWVLLVVAALGALAWLSVEFGLFEQMGEGSGVLLTRDGLTWGQARWAISELTLPVNVTDDGVQVGLAEGGTLDVPSARPAELARHLERLLTRR